MWSLYPGRLGTAGVRSFQFGSALLLFVGAIFLVRYAIYASQVATLKEIKQVQLQILELQGSLRKEEQLGRCAWRLHSSPRQQGGAFGADLVPRASLVRGE